MADPKPFHETIVDVVKAFATHDNMHQSTLRALAKLTHESVIPKNHDAITAAFKEAIVAFGSNDNFPSLFAHIESEKVCPAGFALRLAHKLMIQALSQTEHTLLIICAILSNRGERDVREIIFYKSPESILPIGFLPQCHIPPPKRYRMGDGRAHLCHFYFAALKFSEIVGGECLTPWTNTARPF